MKYAIAVFSIILLFIGCVSERDTMTSWQGHTANELIMSWGAPTTVATDGANGKIYIYQYLQELPGYYGQPNQVYYHLREFYVNTNNVVYYWRTENTSVPAVNVYVH